MNAIDFINKLKDLAVGELKLRDSGYSDDHAKALNEAFFPIKNAKRSLSTDVIIQFIEEYNCEVIGLISPIMFNNEIEELSEKYILVGRLWGEDFIGIDKKKGEVVVLAYWDFNLISYYCAETSNKFMEAFLIHGIGSFGIEFEKEEDKWGYNKIRAREATLVAGGDKYLKFWMDLFETSNQTHDDSNEHGILN